MQSVQFKTTKGRNTWRGRVFFVHLFAVSLLALACGNAAAAARDLRPFSSDGCSLFPDGTITGRNLWCGCCLTHDVAYWQGGTAQDREKADDDLRDCVLERTGNKQLAEGMRLGVRAGGSPVSIMWYRWGYGWPLGRGYKPLSDSEKLRAAAELAKYRQKNPAGYCGEQTAKSTGTAAAQQRPAQWAVPVPSRHLKNFYKLDEKVCRSAQPDEKGFRELEEFGVKNILNLRDYHTDKPAKGSGLKLHRVAMDAGKINITQVVEALRLIKNSEGPVLIHCWHGSDRTGAVSAMYRIVFQGWSKEAAIEELTRGGYGYHAVYKNIPELIQKADVGAVKERVFAP
ncbi:MAG TPA: dual specificity protein phosphatase family protein [Elusimicrobiales bacterium]|nr:dual specificity protein phosphatase family protein [Elusimicrobiales bacterium]